MNDHNVIKYDSRMLFTPIWASGSLGDLHAPRIYDCSLVYLIIVATTIHYCILFVPDHGVPVDGRAWYIYVILSDTCIYWFYFLSLSPDLPVHGFEIQFGPC